MSEDTPSVRRRLAELVAVTAGYTALVLAATWPLALHAVDHLPKGNVPTSVPASAGTWALWWVSDRLPHLFVGMWDAPIFFPVPGAFGFSETTIPLGIAGAPLFWAGATAPLVYNVVILASLVLNGLATRSLAITLRCTPLTASLVGAWAAVSSLGLLWISVLPLVPLYGILWFFRGVVRFSRGPTLALGAEVGATFALSWLLCLQYGIYLTLMAPMVAWILPLREKRTWLGLWAAGIVAGLLLLPVLYPQKQILDTQGFRRSEERSQNGAFRIEGSWLNAPTEPHLGIPAPPRGPGHPLWPGTVAVICIGAGLARRRRDPEVAALLVVTATGVVLSVLPNLGEPGVQAFAWLHDHVPGLSKIRETKRAGAVAVALLPVLAATGLDPVVRSSRPLGVALAFWSMGNQWMTQPAALQRAPVERDHPQLVRALRERVPDDGAVVFVPFLTAEDGSPTPEADRMVLQATHGRRMVNAYSSYYPDRYWELRKPLKIGASETALRNLREAGVTHLVQVEGERWADPSLNAVWEGEGAVLFELVEPPPPAPVPPEGVPPQVPVEPAPISAPR